ncbi:LacI family DNA-binding transcriptional regulator [Staphylococcus kloosii]|uniref:LacI family DNA-binding transcriptional regulator n=1 Tax=Staphylococcus kloosii TaxID=29384 RepID=UPI0028A4CF69|nr:LacI family DNA-binding transcriptional regulator [Staphylococcus kloosii]MDT3959760.1 LacI family DNA-binding transcriptional regulator [Staphylococcus kloosii]
MTQRKPTLHDVAKLAEVSIATVSNVLNDKNNELSDKTKEKVLTAIEKLNYAPNQFARGLKTGQSNIVAFIVPDQNPFFTEVLTSLNDACQQHNLQVAVASSEENEQRQNELIDIFLAQNVSAIIVAPVSSQLTIKEEWNKIPILTLDREIDDSKLPCISVNNEEATYKATERLINQGGKHIGLLLANSDIGTTPRRRNGYELALKDNNLELDENIIFYSNLSQGTEAQVQSGYHATIKLLQENVPAILATNHLLLLGALQACKEMNKVIRQDVIIIGFDDSYWNEIFTPRLSVISQPAKEIGEVAGEMIHDLIKGERVKSTKLATQLIIRDSCSFL